MGSHARVLGSIPSQHIFFEIFFLLISDVHRKLTDTHLEMESGPITSGQFRITWENKINLDFLINQFPYCKNEKFFQCLP